MNRSNLPCNKDAGGSALLSIAWLVPIFGIYCAPVDEIE